jgi:hypothetical protein
MTRTTNARLAGVTSFVYLGAGMSSLAFAGRPQATDVASLFASFSALVLGVTFYALTREQDADLAMMALICRVIEAIPGEGYIYFAVGSTLFWWLMLRGQIIPIRLAWPGFLSSAILVGALVLQRAGVFAGAVNWSGRFTWMTSLPLLFCELTLAVWLLVKGVAAPKSSRAGAA